MQMTDITFDPTFAYSLSLDSISDNATYIEIILDRKDKTIRIKDNGVGISAQRLKTLNENAVQKVVDTLISCQEPSLISRYNNLRNALKIFKFISITSKHKDCVKTYTKIFMEEFNLFKEDETNQLLNGTAVLLKTYDTSLSMHECNINHLCFLIGNISLCYPHITFIIKDEKCIYLKINSNTCSEDILKLMYGKYIIDNFVWTIPVTKVLNSQYHGFIGFNEKQKENLHYIYFNNKQVTSSFLNDILNYFLRHVSYHLRRNDITKNTIFLLLFINCPETEYSVTMQQNKECINLLKSRDILDSIRQFISKLFMDNHFIEKLYNYIQFHLRKQLKKSNQTHLNQVHNDLPSFFYEVDYLKNTYKSNKSILFNTNINHNPMTAFYTHDGIFIYESVKQRNSIENYIINQEHLKTGTFVIKQPKLQNIYHKSNNQRGFKNNIISNISKNFNTKENTEYINRANQSSINITINAKQALSSKQENSIGNRTDYIEDYNCSLFKWSDWSYHTNEVKNDKINENKKNESIKKYKVFDFLPQKLNNLAQFKSVKLIKTPSFDNIDTSIPLNKLTYNYQENRERHQDMDIHPCAFTQHFCEFKLQRTALEFTKVLNQVNNQLIAALMIYDNIELLLMMDQHAVHERIRYENLLNDYKTPDHKSFLTKKLPIPVIIEVTVHMCTLLLMNKKSLDKYGIKLNIINENILSIYCIPKCFITNKQYYNDVKLATTIRNLLNEIVDNIINGNGINMLPLSIHNAVSMEACRGAIKFGQSLSVRECIELFNDLKTTKSPTRCAHGRPSIIPIIELSELRRRCYKNIKKKLNFSRLLTSR